MRSFVLCVVLLALVGCGAVPGVGQSVEQKLAAEIAGHKWWKKKPTAADVGRLAERITAAQKDNIAFIDDEAHLEIVSTEGFDAWQKLQALGVKSLRPKHLNERCINLDLRLATVRPTTTELLESLKATLDAEEFAEKKPR